MACVLGGCNAWLIADTEVAENFPYLEITGKVASLSLTNWREKVSPMWTRLG